MSCVYYVTAKFQFERTKEAMSEDQASSSISSSPEPPEPMDLEDVQDVGADGLEEAVREAVEGQTKEDGVDLRRVAREFAEYLVVDSKQDVSNILIFEGWLYELHNWIAISHM